MESTFEFSPWRTSGDFPSDFNWSLFLLLSPGFGTKPSEWFGWRISALKLSIKNVKPAIKNLKLSIKNLKLSIKNLKLRSGISNSKRFESRMSYCKWEIEILSNVCGLLSRKLELSYTGLFNNSTSQIVAVTFARPQRGVQKGHLKVRTKQVHESWPVIKSMISKPITRPVELGVQG